MQKNSKNYQRSEKKPQEKCHFPPKTPKTIAGVPVSDLLFIAHIFGNDVEFIKQVKDGYAFGHAVGYRAGVELFERKIHEAISRLNSEPIRFDGGGGFDSTKVKFEIPPYHKQEEVINMARFYDVSVIAAPQVINVVFPSTDGDENK